MADDLQRTVHAQQAFEFADVFALKFSIHSFGTSPKRKVKLTEPEVSTDGGRKARQPIVLVAEDETQGRPLVAGWVDVPRHFAEIRSYNLLRQQYESRGNVDISREEYDRAVQEVTAFLRIHRIESTVLDAPPKAPSTIPAPRGASTVDKRDARAVTTSSESAPLAAMSAMLVIGILIGFGLGYLVFGLHVLGSG